MIKNVKVKVVDLLEKLQENRAKHRGIFERAQVGYREKVIEVLDKMLADARANKRIVTAIELPEPVDRTSDYDQAILMLSMTTDEEIELDARTFQQLVMDQWDWKEFFIASNSHYTATN